jgi:hypothetical protein
VDVNLVCLSGKSKDDGDESAVGSVPVAFGPRGKVGERSKHTGV